MGLRPCQSRWSTTIVPGGLGLLRETQHGDHHQPGVRQVGEYLPGSDHDHGSDRSPGTPQPSAYLRRREPQSEDFSHAAIVKIPHLGPGEFSLQQWGICPCNK